MTAFALTALVHAGFAGTKAEPEPPETSTPLPPAEPDPWLGEDEPLLAGPRLEDEGVERTIVKFEFNGGLRRLDRSPEEAALDALTIDGPTRDAADALLRERFTALDEIVRDNLELLVQLNNARQAGNKAEAVPLLGKLSDAMEPLRQEARGRGRLRDEIATLLGDDDRRDFQRMIDEYWRALVKDELQQAESRKEKLSLAQARVRVTLGALGNELRRSFERQFKLREKQFEDFLAALDLTPEQDAKIRKQVQEFVERTRGKPSPRESYDLTMKILPLLTPEQRRALARIMLGVSPMVDQPAGQASGTGSDAGSVAR